MRQRKMVTGVVIAAGIVLHAAAGAGDDGRVRRPLRVPDIPGYQTLRCDLHIHTVFSDGSVWPDVRAEEAWREGLDAIAIADHVEYQPHKDDLPTSHERSFEIARPHGEELGLIVIRGAELSRKMPPGHVNAIFLKSVTPLDTPDWRQALRAARGRVASRSGTTPPGAASSPTAWRGGTRSTPSSWRPASSRGSRS